MLKTFSDTNVLVVNPHQDFKEGQLWELDGETICNQKKTTTVLEVDGSNAEPGATVVSGKDKKRPNQRWIVDYQ